MESNLTPFDHWWKLYASPRKSKKEACRAKFNVLSIEEQRQVYKHTTWGLKNHPDWRVEGEARPFMQGPEVYLNAAAWDGWEPQVASSRPATIANNEDLGQQIHGLEKLQAAGKPDPELQRQIDELKLRFNGRDG